LSYFRNEQLNCNNCGTEYMELDGYPYINCEKCPIHEQEVNDYMERKYMEDETV
jgi:Zn finger protein HypA/HybF involved in hydrogenase expression